MKEKRRKDLYRWKHEGRKGTRDCIIKKCFKSVKNETR